MKDAGTSILGLISQIISSVVWLVTVLTRVIVLRRHLLALVPLVARQSTATSRFDSAKKWRSWLRRLIPPLFQPILRRRKDVSEEI